jgi:hypothetical protein
MTGLMKDIFARLKDGPNNRKYKVTKIWWGKPSKELEKAYKAKKKSYMEDKVAKWLDMLTDEKGDKKLTHARDIAKKILEEPAKYQTEGKFDYVKILANFEVGGTKAREIVRTAETLAQ